MSDEYFMNMALEEARISANRGDLPVGSVLTIDGGLIGRAGNSATSKDDWTSHAEYLVLNQFSSVIKRRKSGDNVLYTTWEPCLMCMGCSVLSRVSEIVYACPDPSGGVASVDPLHLGEWYVKKWPKIRQGPFREESFNLLEKVMLENLDRWGSFLERFRRGMDAENREE
ncbi:MAG: nucleoside deaminase [Nanoarchaeota archaeon]|nr:nucleoside deaminase [Nanoarchaeota archaeon]